MCGGGLEVVGDVDGVKSYKWKSVCKRGKWTTGRGEVGVEGCLYSILPTFIPNINFTALSKPFQGCGMKEGGTNCFQVLRSIPCGWHRLGRLSL